jgi:hypothetical protein
MTRPTHTQQRPATGQAASPFHWRQFTDSEAGPDRPASQQQPAARAKRPATARDRAERILAHRWSGAYSRAGSF